MEVKEILAGGASKAITVAPIGVNIYCIPVA
jgi:hypothetical protein